MPPMVSRYGENLKQTECNLLLPITYKFGRQYQHKPDFMCSSLRDDHKRSKETRIARMRRICSFTDFYFVVPDCMRLSGAWILTDLPQLEESGAVQAQENQY